MFGFYVVFILFDDILNKCVLEIVGFDIGYYVYVVEGLVDL